ncbi:MAG: hypothetical protein FD548_000436 [Pelagibacterales bacterium]|nr:hypothetical protein [Pelagibacterales bacterium]
MKRSSRLNKFIKTIFFLTTIIFIPSLSVAAVDIWEKKDDSTNANNQAEDDEIIIKKNTKFSDEAEEEKFIINEEEIKTSNQSIIGIFDPEINNFSLNLWSQSNGEDIKRILKRINKIKLSKFSEDLLFRVLFTNAYPPKKNLSSEEFLKLKINWLIKNRRFKDLEVLLKNNDEVGKQPKVIKFLINEYLSSSDIKSACEKSTFMNKEVKNNYLDKFSIYCLINEDRKEEAQLLFDLAKERGLKDSFFEDKINFLLGITDKTTSKISDNNLLNFYLSHITSKDFIFEPNEKTDKYIWRYLSSANLLQDNSFENEEIVLTYEQAAASNSFENEEVFKIYLRMYFNFNQLLNVEEVYKTLPKYKARALIYQSILLSTNIERKLYLTFLLKDIFAKDKLLSVFTEELSIILRSLDPDEIPENYLALVKKNLEQNIIFSKKIKFKNDVLHRSKVIKHFLDKNHKNSKTEKDLKEVYKKIKKNKKYFISIKDIVVLESLKIDGVTLPKELNLIELSGQLTIPNNLVDLVSQKQTGLVMLKIIEIIGEDNIYDLDPETIYFLNKILNELNLKKIRNDILSETLPWRV